MNYYIRELKTLTESELLGICDLWSSSFGDDKEFITSFYEKMPVHSTVCCFFEDIPVSMAVLLRVGSAYYGYAVCTLESHRRKGLCRLIHNYIREKCEAEGIEYFVHPASEELSAYYLKLGMKPVLSYFEVRTISFDKETVLDSSPEEYARIRDLYFGGNNYYPWDVSALQFMKDNGVSFKTAFICGCECGCALEGNTIIELCAPEYLSGNASSAFLLGSGKLGNVRFFTEVNHIDNTALLSFSGNSAYFNLFFE